MVRDASAAMDAVKICIILELVMAVAGAGIHGIVSDCYGVHWLWLPVALIMAAMAVLARPGDARDQAAVWIPVAALVMAGNLNANGLCLYALGGLVFLGFIVREWGHAIRDDN